MLKHPGAAHRLNSSPHIMTKQDQLETVQEEKMSPRFPFALAAALMFLGSAHASTIATIQTQPSGTPGQTADNGPVITAILSQPGMFNGRAYSNWALFVNDGTGGMEVYASAAAMSGFGYTPAVGDIVNVTGTYAPYHQIPSLSPLTAITPVSSGNSVPPPLLRTIADINLMPLPLTVGGYMVQLDNVTIAGQSGTFGLSDSPPGATITDATGTMRFYYWQSNFSAANVNLFGQPVPTEPVSMIGFVSVYVDHAEFHPITIIPEPAALGVLASGVLIMLRRRRCRWVD